MCRSCTEKEESTCPGPVSIFAPNLQELRQNITFIFNPSLNDSRIPTFQISAEEMIEKHLSFKFKRNGKNEQPLTILDKKLTHSSQGSQLLVSFLQKMRITNTEYVLLAIEEPWLFRPLSSEEPQVLKYFIKKDYRISIVSQDGQSEREKTIEQTLSAFRITRMILGIIASVSIVIAGCSGLMGPLVHLIRFLNIVEIISNLEKININFGARIESVIEFIEKLKIPEFGTLSRLSPIQDYSFKGADVNAYLLNTRGSRGKITTSNGELLIASGQSFIVGVLIIGFWSLSSILSCFLNKKSKVLRVLSFIYQTLLAFVFFDYQLICLAEIALFDYSKIRKTKFSFLLSLMMSYVLMLLMAREFFRGFDLVRKHLNGVNPRKKSKSEGVEHTEADKQLLDKCSRTINFLDPGAHIYYSLIDKLRFSAIQLAIVSLQLLNRTQALIVLIANSAFFFYFVVLACRVEIFKARYLMDKTILQECCILMTLVTITLFSFTETSRFSSSSIFKVFELATVGCIIATVLSELGVMLVGAYLQLSEIIKKTKRKGSKSDSSPKKLQSPKKKDKREDLTRNKIKIFKNKCENEVCLSTENSKLKIEQIDSLEETPRAGGEILPKKNKKSRLEKHSRDPFKQNHRKKSTNFKLKKGRNKKRKGRRRRGVAT